MRYLIFLSLLFSSCQDCNKVPKFRYRDEVRIKTGFYRAETGYVIDYRFESCRYTYALRIYGKERAIWFKESEIKRID